MRRTGPGPVAAIGGVLLLVGAGLLVALAFRHGFDHAWREEVLVPADGSLHEVRLDGSGPALLWGFDAESAPECSVKDVGSGEVLGLRPAAGGHRRAGGSAGDWVASAGFDASSSTVAVRCEPSGGSPPSVVAVERAPRTPAPFSAWGTWAGPAASAVLAGLLLLLGAVCAAWTGRVRRVGGSPARG